VHLSLGELLSSSTSSILSERWIFVNNFFCKNLIVLVFYL
jgi:hypothetical protein